MKSHVRIARLPEKFSFPPFVISIFHITVCGSGNDLEKKSSFPESF